jgi:hypothetical protein
MLRLIFHLILYNVLISEKLYEQIWSIESKLIKEIYNSYAQEYINYIATEKNKTFESLKKEIWTLEDRILIKTIF